MKKIIFPFTILIASMVLSGCSIFQEEEEEVNFEKNLHVEKIVEKPNVKSNVKSPIFMDVKLNTKFIRSDDKLFRFYDVNPKTWEMTYQKIDKAEGDVVFKVSKEDIIEYVKKISNEYENLLTCETDYKLDYSQIERMKQESKSQEMFNGFMMVTYDKTKYRINDSPCFRTVHYKEELVKKKMVRKEFNKYSYSISVTLEK
jgi:hypothetical protein